MDFKPLLVLDLDETLIHTSDVTLGYLYDTYFESDDAVHGVYYVYGRPYLDDFLEEIFKHYHVGIWSSGTEDYVNKVLEDMYLPKFEFVWARDRCTVKRNINTGFYQYEKHLKKLTKLGYSLERMLIVDDSPEKCRANYGNAIIIPEWVGNDGDDYLNRLLDYLISIKDCENFRTLDKRNWLHN